MRIMLFEVKKMLIHQKRILFLVLFFALSLASVPLFDKPANADMELYSEQYHHYLTAAEGALTAQKEALFQAEAGRLSEAQIALDGIYEDFYNGKISGGELAQKARQLEAVLHNRKGFELIYEQYAYVRENSHNRYFLDTNGWNALLSNEQPDLLLFSLLLLLITPIFTSESASKMDSLLRTERAGGRYTANRKIGLAICVTLLLCLFTFGIRCLFSYASYGLRGGNFPLQSLPYFAASSKNLTLLQAFICISVCKILGYLLLSMLILFVSVCVKKYPLALLICTGAVLLPYAGFASQSEKYRFLFPLNFMQATGFFKGSESRLDTYTGQQVTQFTEISSPMFTALILIAVCLGTAMFFAIRHRCTNAWNVKLPLRKQRVFGLLLIVCAYILGGCALQSEGGYDAYNTASKGSFENEKYCFSVTYKEGKADILCKDKNTAETQNLIRSPLQAMSQVSESIYGNGKAVYYAKYDIDKSGLKPLLDRFSIVEVDTESFQEKVVFEKNISEAGSNILGARSVKNSDSRFFAVYAFFLDKRSVFIVGESEILQISRATGAETQIPITGKGNIAYDGRSLYYLNEKHQIVKHDAKSGSEAVFTNAVMEHFCLTDSEILYRNRQDGDKIYGMSLDGKATYKISERSVLSVRGDRDYIYFIDAQDLKEHRMKRGDIEAVNPS